MDNAYIQRVLKFTQIRYLIPIDNFLLLLLVLYAFSLFPYGIFHLLVGVIEIFYVSMLFAIFLIFTNIYHFVFEFNERQKFIIGFLFCVLYSCFLLLLCSIVSTENQIWFWFYPAGLVFYCATSPFFAFLFNALLLPVIYLSFYPLLSTLGSMHFFFAYVVVLFFANIASVKICSDKRDLLKLSSIDSITGLKNRIALKSVIKEFYFISWFKPTRKLNAVICFDVANTEKINNLFGYSVVDIILQRISKLIQKNIADKDLLYRYDKTGFVLFIKSGEKENLLNEARRLQQLVADAIIFSDAEPIEIYCGVASREEGELLEATLIKADKALIAARINNRETQI